MIFLSYEFVVFAVLFYLLYFLIPLPAFRLTAIIASSLAFQWLFGGWYSVLPVGVLAIATFVAGRWEHPRAIDATIVLCIATLVFFKYTYFVTDRMIAPLAPALGASLGATIGSLVPPAIPLGISFFTFEFVHYLVELRRGGKPIRHLCDFLGFALFWPTLVAGPIKRYQQFIPSMTTGLAHPTATDAMVGVGRIAIGFVKKWAADNLTAWLSYNEQFYLQMGVEARWLILLAIMFRILLDFSGYSDMAIGFARMMGIVVPENFNWPYIARSPIEFWQRWHMSLSSWIRDYVYIPLGGNRLGLPRRIFNVSIAMALCGLWHGANWNFLVWGLYHGGGLSIASLLEGRFRGRGAPLVAAPDTLHGPCERLGHLLRIGPWAAGLEVTSWLATMLFVAFGWLLFFYPLDKAWLMFQLLFRR